MASTQVAHPLVSVSPFPFGLGAGTVTLGGRGGELAAGHAERILQDGSGRAGMVELLTDRAGLDLGTLGTSVCRLGSRDGASSPLLGLCPGRGGDFRAPGGGVTVLLGGLQTLTRGCDLAAQLCEVLLGLLTRCLGRGPGLGELAGKRLQCDITRRDLLAHLTQGHLELLGEPRGFHSCFVRLGALSLGLALSLLGARGARGRRRNPLGGVGRHRLDLGLSSIRVRQGPQLIDERVQLLDKVLPHPRDLPTDLTSALTRRINGAILVDHGPPRRLLGRPTPRAPRRRPGVPRIVAVLRWAPRDALNRNNHPHTPREPARALLRQTKKIAHNVILA